MRFKKSRPVSRAANQFSMIAGFTF